MDEHAWLTICFFAFLFLAGKHIYKGLVSFLKGQQDFIEGEIKKAELILTKASQNLAEAKSMYEELDSSVSYIFQQAAEALEYDLKARKDNFEKDLNIKEKQIDNLINKAKNDFKKDMVNLLIKNIHSKFLLHFTKNKKDLEQFTEFAIKAISL